MSLKRMLGGEVNHKFIEKQKRKATEQEEEYFAITLKRWKKSQNPVEIKIKNLIEYYKNEPNYPKRFLARYPELVPPELNPFMKNQNNTEDLLDKKQRYIDELIDWNKELQEENHQLKVKLKKYEQSQ